MISANPRLDLLRWEVERTVLKPFRLHGWAAEIVREVDRDDCIEITAQRGRSQRGSRVAENSRWQSFARVILRLSDGVHDGRGESRMTDECRRD